MAPAKLSGVAEAQNKGELFATSIETNAKVCPISRLLGKQNEMITIIRNAV